MKLIVNGEASFFEQYAAANDHEFFAVAIENFFERPLEFNDFHSPMYTSLTRQKPGSVEWCAVANPKRRTIQP